MKKNIIFLILAGFALFSCGEDRKKEEDAGSRPFSYLSVTYSVQGSEVTRVNFSSRADSRTLLVDMNNESLKWHIESDRNWCVVKDEDHQGSGSFTIEVQANEDFDPRDEATLTFVAGNFRGFTLTVSQSGTAFIIGQPYFLCSKNSSEVSVEVTTLEETQWEVSGPEWLSVSREDGESVEGLRTTVLTIDVEPNTDASRYGTLSLSASDGEYGSLAVAQLGTELSYDDDDVIFLERDGKQSISFIAPEFTIGYLKLPDWVSSETISNGDGTETVTLSFNENLSDCSEIRESLISMVLTNASLSQVELPLIRQDYVPAFGLVTSKGVKAFADAVAAGESTADWETDGVVVLKGDVDMSDIQTWEGIGTETSPFAGKFNGNGFGILNLKKAAGGFFHYISGASLSNLKMMGNCTVYVSGTFEATLAVGGVVDYAFDSSISDCSFGGDMEVASVAEDEGDLLVGGIVGVTDATSIIKSCKTSGKVSVTSNGGSNTVLFAGGIAAKSGELTRCEVTGDISVSSSIATTRVGGVMAALESGNKIGGNTFSGKITIDGTSREARIGGLYATAGGEGWVFDNAGDKSVTMGSIDISGFAVAATSRIFAGGMVGFAEEGTALTFRGYELHTNFIIDDTANRTSDYFVTGGAFGASDPDGDGAPLVLDNLINHGGITVKYVTAAKIQGKRTLHGGVAGFVKGELTVTDCVNEGTLGTPVTTNTSAPYTTNTANYMTVMGGIVASAEGGNASFSGCSNTSKAVIYNYQYNNRVVPTHTYEGHYCGNVNAGILGVFDYYPADGGYTLSITGCSNMGILSSFRGLVGNIVGYAKNATISSCSATVDLLSSKHQSNASHKGGIAGVLAGESNVSGCTVRSSLSTTNPGGALATPGGIVGVSVNSLALENCSWYGEISGTVASGVYFGGLIGTGTSGTTITSCKFGGKVGGTPVSENNISSLAIGNGIGTIDGLSVWNGD